MNLVAHGHVWPLGLGWGKGKQLQSEVEKQGGVSQGLGQRREQEEAHLGKKEGERKRRKDGPHRKKESGPMKRRKKKYISCWWKAHT